MGRLLKMKNTFGRTSDWDEAVGEGLNPPNPCDFRALLFALFKAPRRPGWLEAEGRDTEIARISGRGHWGKGIPSGAMGEHGRNGAKARLRRTWQWGRGPSQLGPSPFPGRYFPPLGAGNQTCTC